TGACVPADCDTVIPYEDLSDDRSTVREPFKPGQFIHTAGSDAKAGDILVPTGRLIGPSEIAIAASVGVSHPEVAARPRVALITSGDEVVEITATPEPWQIRRSNGPMLEATLRHLGHDPVSHHIPDEPDASRRVLHGALESVDVLIL